MKLKERDQEEILALAMTDVLYKVTQDNRHVIICLPQENAYFQDDSDISEDGVTEKVRINETSEEKLSKMLPTNKCFLVVLNL